MTITIAPGTDVGDIYGNGPTTMWLGDFATLDREASVVGTIESELACKESSNAYYAYAIVAWLYIIINIYLGTCDNSNKSVDIKSEKTPDIRLKTQL